MANLLLPRQIPLCYFRSLLISYWFSQNMLINQVATFAPNQQQPGIADSPVNGDLQLQGLNLQFEFDF